MTSRNINAALVHISRKHGALFQRMQLVVFCRAKPKGSILLHISKQMMPFGLAEQHYPGSC